MVQIGNSQIMGIIHQARHPHKHIFELPPMANHSLQVHVECFGFEGIIISCKWTIGFLNVYMNDVNSAMDRWQTPIFFETGHNFYPIFPFTTLYLIFARNIHYKYKFLQHHMDC